jgi:hypothetical protein
MRKLLQAVLLAGLVLGVNASTARAADREAIEKAIDKGVTALRGLQGADGTWPYPDIGATALAGLTLLECGAKPDDKAVRLAADAVRKASLTLTHIYSIALSILFFDRLGDPADVPLIESLTVRLLSGQTASGGWNYRSPPISAAEMRRLQAQLNQRKELAGRREPPKPGDKRRKTKDLPMEIQQQLAALHRMGGPTVVGSDNSNTQFATLALWVARRHGLPVEEALKRVEARFRSSQHADGGWGYFEQGMRGPMTGSTASMTCAGLLGLAVADGQTLEAKPAKAGSKPPTALGKDPRIPRGLLALSTAIGSPADEGRKPGERPVRGGAVGGRTYYFLWSLERVAVALDLQTIGKKDWYAWGADILLANQQEDGSWQGFYGECGADTCFALLFLKRANLAPDLTTQLTGQVRDPGERVLKGGVAVDPLKGEKIADLKPGIESKDAKRPIEGKYPTFDPDRSAPKTTVKPVPDRPADTKPLPDRPADTKVADTIAGRMAADLVKSSGSRQTQLLQQMQQGKGPDFTEALALAIPRLFGEPRQKARTALAERLARMKDSTLTTYLADEDAEIRRAAASAIARKESKALVPQLIPLLRDPNPGVADAAHMALSDLTRKDFGPKADVSREEREEAIRKWLEWWNKQERK